MALTPQQQLEQNAARAMGYTGAFGGGAFNTWRQQNGITDAMWQQATTAPDFNGGVSPIGQIEPFNQYQKTALTNLAQPLPAAPQYNWVEKAVTPMSMEGLQPYMNPYQQAVIDRSTNAINQQADIARNKIMGSRAPGSRSFGDSAMAIQLGQLDANTAKQIADYTAQANSDNFMQAQNQYNTQAQRYIQGENALLDSTGRRNDMSVANYKNMLASGGMIQQQNQALLDVLRGQITGRTDFPYTQVQRLGQNLNAIPGSSTQQGAQPQSPNMMQAGLGGAMAGLGLYNAFSGGGSSTSSSAPINGLGGYY